MFRIESKRYWLKFYTITTLCYLISTFFRINNEVRYALFALPIVAILFTGCTIIDLRVLLSWLSAIIVVALHLDMSDKSGLYFLLVMVLCILFCSIKFAIDNNEIDIIKKLFISIALINTAFQLIEFLIPELFANIVSTIYGNISYELIVRYHSEFSYSGLLIHTYNVVIIDAISLAILFFDYTKEKHIHQILILLVSLLLSGSRSNIVSIPFVISVVYIISQPKKQKTTTFFKTIFAILCMLMILVLIGNLFGNSFAQVNSVVSLAGSFFKTGEISDGRSILYAKALDLFRNNSMWGIGWFQFRKYSTNLLGLGVGSDVHNVYLQLLCEVGIIGSIFFLLPFLYYVITTIKFITSNSVTGETKTTGVISLFIQIYMLVSSAFHATFYNLFYIGIYFLAIKMIIALKCGDVNEKGVND